MMPSGKKVESFSCQRNILIPCEQEAFYIQKSGNICIVYIYRLYSIQISQWVWWKKHTWNNWKKNIPQAPNHLKHATLHGEVLRLVSLSQCSVHCSRSTWILGREAQRALWGIRNPVTKPRKYTNPNMFGTTFCKGYFVDTSENVSSGTSGI